VCTAYAKSIGVAPSGSAWTSPRGVKTKTSLLPRVERQRVEELARIRGLLLPLRELVDPGQLLLAGRPGVLRALLVLPVRGDAVLGATIHLLGADLELDRAASRPHNRRVQRLVHVVLRERDVVLDPARHGTPAHVDDTHRRVAVGVVLDEDPQTQQVVDVPELPATDDHLLVDRVVVLRPPVHGRWDLR